MRTRFLSLHGAVLPLTLALSTVLAPMPTWASPGAHGPNGEHLDVGATPQASGLGRLPDGSLNVPKNAQRRLGLRTLLAPETEAAATVALAGRVVAHPSASGHVQSLHGGRIEPGPKGLPLPGQAVRRGDVLAYVRHHADPFTTGTQKAQWAELKAQREIAEQRLQRLEGLAGSVPRKDIEAARAEARSLAQREAAIGDSLRTREALLAPVSGVVARSQLAVGQVVDARELLVEIVDPGRLLVEATSSDTRLASRIDGAHLQDVSGGELRLLGGARALRDGVLPLSFALQGQDLGLALGQPVTVLVRLNERAKGVVLPAEAVVKNANGESVVWIKSGAERFIAQPVQVRALDARTVLVVQGLAADNRVVVQGAALINQIR
jgi:hypothetical protein